MVLQQPLRHFPGDHGSVSRALHCSMGGLESGKALRQYLVRTHDVLGSMSDVGPFQDCVRTVAQATVQQLNLDKVELLRVGAAAGQQDGTEKSAHNLRVARTAATLNLAFTDDSQINL
jgi:hypothetical protein